MSLTNLTIITKMEVLYLSQAAKSIIQN